MGGGEIEVREKDLDEGNSIRGGGYRDSDNGQRPCPRSESAQERSNRLQGKDGKFFVVVRGGSGIADSTICYRTRGM